MRILVIATGGTIGSVRGESIALDSNNLKIIEYCRADNVELVGVSPFSVLSENMTLELWQRLIDYVDSVDFDEYDGVIILHGSDTLAYTSAIIANAFWDKSIVLTASNKPVEDKDSNAVDNFNLAVDLIKQGISKPMVSYDGVHSADAITSADIKDCFLSLDTSLEPVKCKKLNNKNILIVKLFVGINPNYYNLENVDAVIVDMYHSATVPDDIKAWSKESKAPFYFVTHKVSAEYETAQDIDNFVFGCTVENCYARLLLTN